MHIRKNVNCICDYHIHDEMRESTDRVRTLNPFDVSERRESMRRFHDVMRSLPHFGKEVETKTCRSILVVVGGLLKLSFRFGLDEEPHRHLALSFASRRSNTSSSGLPEDRPARTRSARRAISVAHSETRFATDSFGAMASMTALRSSSVSSEARAMTSRTAALDMTK